MTPPFEHHLKTLPQPWEAIGTGSKTFEVRWNDRNFRVGEILVLHRLVVRAGFEDSLSTMVPHRRVITYVMQSHEHPGIAPGYVVMGLGEVS